MGGQEGEGPFVPLPWPPSPFLLQPTPVAQMDYYMGIPDTLRPTYSIISVWKIHS